MRAVGVSGRLCILMDEMGCFEFLSFFAGIDVAWVYGLSADGHVSSSSGDLSEEFKNILKDNNCVI